MVPCRRCVVETRRRANNGGTSSSDVNIGGEDEGGVLCRFLRRLSLIILSSSSFGIWKDGVTLSCERIGTGLVIARWSRPTNSSSDESGLGVHEKGCGWSAVMNIGISIVCGSWMPTVARCAGMGDCFIGMDVEDKGPLTLFLGLREDELREE